MAAPDGMDGDGVVLTPGSVLRERYRIVRAVSDGMLSRTYLAEHEFLDFRCIIKTLAYTPTDAATATHLRDEAVLGARVDHPNVVRVIECDQHSGTWYFVMEYVEGGDLGEVTRHAQRLPWQRVAAIGADAACGLSAIHARELIHHDIKPANLILSSAGQVKIADLGIATLAWRESRAARSAAADLSGTLAYAAPEVFAAGETIDQRSDLYALGATLYHLLTGRAPHANAGVFGSVLDRHTRSVQWPADGSIDAPAWMRALILSMLAPNPADRPSTAREVCQQLGGSSAELRQSASDSSLPAPRGIAVLPFTQAERADTPEWVRLALADGIVRTLSRIPGVYAVDPEKFAGVLSGRGKIGDAASPEQLLQLGRFLGAAIVVEGRLETHAAGLEVRARVHSNRGPTTAEIAPVIGTPARLAELTATLLERLAPLLQLDSIDTSYVQRVFASTSAGALEKFVLGKQAYVRGDYPAAIQFAEDARVLDPDFIEPLQYAGVCYARLGRHEEAARCHELQEAIAVERGDSRLLVEAHANMGVMYYFRSDWESAIRFYVPAARRAAEIGLTGELANIHNNLGFALVRLGRLREAEDAFRRAIFTHQEYGALISLIGPYNGMGNVLLDQQRFDEARAYYRRALLLAEELGDRANTGVAYMHLGRCAALAGDDAAAAFEFSRSVAALEETRFWSGLNRAYEFMADSNLRLTHYAAAIRCADKRIALARLQANARLETAAWQQKAEALRRAGREREADDCLARAES